MFAIKSSFKVPVPSKGLRDRVCRGEPSMKRSRWALAVFLAIFPIAARAQEGGAGKVPLTSRQKLGQRVFEQRCGICHAPARPGFQMYGPALYKDLVNGNEDAIKEMILSGSGKMPGFKL